jgi:hypothetical protein
VDPHPARSEEGGYAVTSREMLGVGHYGVRSVYTSHELVASTPFILVLSLCLVNLVGIAVLQLLSRDTHTIADGRSG